MDYKIESYSQFFLAIKQGEHEKIQRLLNRITAGDINVTAETKVPLIEAAKYGRVKITKMLLEKGAQVDLQDKFLKSALMVASEQEHLKKGDFGVVKALLERGAAVDLTDADGFTALLHAARVGKVKIVKTLLECGASVDLQGKNGASALTFACERRQLNLAVLLLANGAMVDLQNGNGDSALIIASYKGDCELAQLFLENGAQIDLCESEGWTALMWASEQGHTQVVDLLLQRGAKVDLQNNDGLSALILASYNGHLKIVQLLLQCRANVHMRENSPTGSSPLIKAIEGGHYEVTELLLQGGALANLCDNNGWSPLMYACRKGDYESVEALLEHGACVDIQSNSCTGLMFACLYGHSDIAKLLIAKGARTDLEDCQGESITTGKKYSSHFQAEAPAKPALHKNPTLNHPIVGPGASVSLQMCRPGNSSSPFSHSNLSYGTAHSFPVDARLELGHSSKSSAIFNPDLGRAALETQRRRSIPIHMQTAGCSSSVEKAKNNVPSTMDTTPCSPVLNDASRDYRQEPSTYNLHSKSTLSFSPAQLESKFLEACSHGNYDDVKVMLESGVDPNSCERRTRTSALMNASNWGHLRVVELLLYNGAQVDLCDAQNYTAEDYAALYGYRDVCKLLKEHMKYNK